MGKRDSGTWVQSLYPSQPYWSCDRTEDNTANTELSPVGLLFRQTNVLRNKYHSACINRNLKQQSINITGHAKLKIQNITMTVINKS